MASLIVGRAGKTDRTEIVTQIAEYLSIDVPRISSGSTVVSEPFLDSIAQSLNLHFNDSSNNYRKLQFLIEHLGGSYDQEQDSSEYKGPSGGGTITNHGWRKLCRLLTGKPACFIFNYADHAVSDDYQDVLGKSYGFDENVTGRVSLLEASAGSNVVFYKTSKASQEPKQVFFAEAVVETVITLEEGKYRAVLKDYREYTNPIKVADTHIENWNNQHGIAEISFETFEQLKRHGLPVSQDSSKGSNDEDFIIDVRPDASSLRMYKDMKFTPQYALGEFIDNSITSALWNIDGLKSVYGTNYKLQVSISFPEGTNSLVVEDNAAGIKRENIPSALKTGRPPADTSVGLSKYGVGMKAASFWWGSLLKIQTYPIGEDTGWEVTVDVSGAEDVPANVAVHQIPHRGRPGTVITVENLWQNTPKAKAVAAIRAYLPSIYRSYLGEQSHDGRQLNFNLSYQGTDLSFTPPALLKSAYWPNENGPAKDAVITEWRKDVSIPLDSGEVVTGWIGILQKMSRDLSGLVLQFKGKGILGANAIGADASDDDFKGVTQQSSYKPRVIFGQVGSKLDQSFIGEFDVSQLGKTITTDGVPWSPEQEEDFGKKLLLELQKGEQPFFTMAKVYRRKLNQRTVDDQGKIEQSDKAEEGRAKRLDGELDHGPQPDSNDSPGELDGQPDHVPDSQVDRSLSFDLNDQEGHKHVFYIAIVEDRMLPFLSLSTETDTHNHRVTVNLAHAFLDGIEMTVDVRKTIQRIVIAYAAAEVFSGVLESPVIREKFNFTLKKLREN